MLWFLLSVLAVSSIPVITATYDISFGLCVDTSTPMKRVVENIRSGMKEVLDRRQFSDYVVVPYYDQTIESGSENSVQNFIKMMDVHHVNEADKYKFEYHRLLRAIELSRRDGIIFFFTNTISNFDEHVLIQAEAKNIVIQFFVRNCCLTCTDKEIRFRIQINNRGHGVFCILPTDVLNIFLYSAKPTTTPKTLRNRGTFMALLNKLSLTYSIEVSTKMQSHMTEIAQGIEGIVSKSPPHLMNYGVMSNETVYFYSKPSQVSKSFSNLQFQVIDPGVSVHLMNERLRKSIVLSKQMSIIYSFMPSMYRMPDPSIFQSADRKKLSIQFFLTNCTIDVDQLKTHFAKMHHGIHCLKPTYLKRLMDFVPKMISKRTVIHPLRLKGTYEKLFSDDPIAAGVTPSSHPSPQPYVTKPTDTEYVKVPYIKLPLLPHRGHGGITINNNISVPIHHRYGCKCGGATLVLSSFLKILILSKLVSFGFN